MKISDRHKHNSKSDDLPAPVLGRNPGDGEGCKPQAGSVKFDTSPQQIPLIWLPGQAAAIRTTGWDSACVGLS
jgi:hypothetical protein